MFVTHREYDNNIIFPFDDYTQIELDLKALERLVNKDVLNAARGNETCAARPQIARR